MKIFIITTMFFCLNIFSQEQQENLAKQRGAGNDQNSNWSIQYSIGKSHPQGSDELSASNSTLLFLGLFSNNPALMYLGTREIKPEIIGHHGRFIAEFLPSYIGFQFGMNYASYSVTYKDDTAALGSLLLLQSLSTPSTSSGSTTNSAANSFLLPLLLSGPSVETFAIHSNTLDFASSFHIRPRKTIDPYANIGIGVGTCGNACTVGKGFGRLGIRLNLGGGYLFLEGEYSESSFRPAGAEKSIKFTGSHGMFGFGLYL